VERKEIRWSHFSWASVLPILVSVTLWWAPGASALTPSENVEYISSTLWTGIVDVDVVGEYAYCAFWNGLGIVDVSDPSQPILVSKLYLHGRAWGIDVDGVYAYLADDWAGLQVIAISSPENP